MKVTRILQADAPKTLRSICKATGFLRADIWRRYGGLKNAGKSNIDIRKEITVAKIYANLKLDGTIRNETTKDVVNDILLYKAAAKQKVRKAVAARTDDQQERKRLYSLLKADRWLEDPYLSRKMRKHFRHGRSQVNNQFIVRSDKFTTAVVDGYLAVTIRIALKHGSDIVLTTTTNGKNVDLGGRNLRIILKNDTTEIHYAAEKAPGRPHGSKELGVDKGYTEALVDSDGQHHGQQFGAILTQYSDKTHRTGKARNKLYALEKKHRKRGKINKADNILINNLGRKKLDTRKQRAQQQLRTIAFQAVHQVVDKAELVVSEDLTAVFAKKWPWKRFNRRMSTWAKGVLAEALESVTKQRGARHHLVNCAYTSQTDSCSGLLEGKRRGDKFHRITGDVLQADHNAARNVLARLYDQEIGLYTPFNVKGHELGSWDRQPCADKS